MGFLEINPDFVLAIAVIDRAFHGKNFFYILLFDLFARRKDNEPEKGTQADNNCQST
jgi:hypothetical protein